MSDTLNAPTAHGAATSSNGQSTALGDRVRSLRLGSTGTGKSGGSPRGGLLPWGLALIFFLAASAFGFLAYTRTPTNDANDSAEQTANNTGERAATAATPTTSTATSGEVLLESKGYVIASHQIQLSPQVGGEIIWLDPDFKEGAIYKKGDPLAIVDPVIYRAQLKSAEAALSEKKVNLQQVESGSTLKEISAVEALLANLDARLRLSMIDERNKRRGGASTTNDDLEKAAVQLQADQAAYENQKQLLAKLKLSLEEQRGVNKAQVQSAQAAVDQATKQLKNCSIVAPVTGSILTKKAELGGYVNPFAFGAAGSLCEMADLADLEVDLDIQERDIARITVGNRCLIMPEAFARDAVFKKKHPDGYEGVYERRLPIANRAKGAITVRVKVRDVPKEEEGVYLMPDMGAIVTFKAK